MIEISYFLRSRKPIAVFLVICLIIIFLILILKPDWTLRSDSFNYYVYVRSVFKDHDLNFSNEGLFFKEKFHVITKSYFDVITSTGYYPNPFTVGVSIFEIPWYLLAETYIKISSYNDTNELSGFTPIHDKLINFGNILYGFLGLIIVYKFLRLYFKETTSLIAVFFLFFATPLIYLTIYEAAWSHLLAFLLVSAFIYFWYGFKNISVQNRYLISGFLIGLNFLVRWQNVMLLIILIPELIVLSRNNKIGFIKYSTIFGISFLIAISPQLIAWKIIYGEYILKPPSNTQFSHLLDPQIFLFFFSKHHGMFWWTPIYFLSSIGLVYFIRAHLKNTPSPVFARSPVRDDEAISAWGLLRSARNDIFEMGSRNKSKHFLPLIIFLLLELYINTSISDWWGGGGGTFGARRMIDYSLIYGVGLASIFDIKKLYLKSTLFAISLLFCLINFSLMLQAVRGWLLHIDPDKAYPYNQYSGLILPTPKQFIDNSDRIFKAVYRNLSSKLRTKIIAI